MLSRSTKLSLVLGALALALAPAPAAGFAVKEKPPAAVSRRGSLGRKVVQLYMRWHTAKVRHCYERELGKRPALRVAVTVRFIIEPTGKVTAVHAEPSTPSVENRDLSRCVAAAVGKVHFPEVFDVLADGTRAYGDRTSVRYRFRFKPAKRKRGPRPLARRGRLRGLDPLDEVLARGGLSKGIKPPKLRSLQPVFRRAPGASQPQPQPPPPPGVGPSGKPPTVKNAKGDDPLQGIDLDSP